MDSADSVTGETWLEQLVSVKETLGADSDDVYVCELIGLLPVGFRNRFDLCVVYTSNVAQFFSDIPRKILSAVAVREYSCSVRFFTEDSADHGRANERILSRSTMKKQSRRKQSSHRKSIVAVEERSDTVSGAASCAAPETESDTKQMSQVRNGAADVCAVAQSQCLVEDLK